MDVVKLDTRFRRPSRLDRKSCSMVRVCCRSGRMSKRARVDSEEPTLKAMPNDGLLSRDAGPMMLGFLDFRALCRLRPTSKRAKTMIEERVLPNTSVIDFAMFGKTVPRDIGAFIAKTCKKLEGVIAFSDKFSFVMDENNCQRSKSGLPWWREHEDARRRLVEYLVQNCPSLRYACEESSQKSVAGAFRCVTFDAATAWHSLPHLERDAGLTHAKFDALSWPNYDGFGNVEVLELQNFSKAVAKFQQAGNDLEAHMNQLFKPFSKAHTLKAELPLHAFPAVKRVFPKLRALCADENVMASFSAYVDSITTHFPHLEKLIINHGGFMDADEAKEMTDGIRKLSDHLKDLTVFQIPVLGGSEALPLWKVFSEDASVLPKLKVLGLEVHEWDFGEVECAWEEFENPPFEAEKLNEDGMDDTKVMNLLAADILKVRPGLKLVVFHA